MCHSVMVSEYPDQKSADSLVLYRPFSMAGIHEARSPLGRHLYVKSLVGH
jgi:hypothetical protein